MKFSVLDAVSTTLVAMTIVFALLIVLQYIIRIQSFILKFIGKKRKGTKVELIHNQEEEKEQVVYEYEEKVQPLDDLQVVAVITATLSAYLEIPGSNLRIKSIKRVNNNWGPGVYSVGNDK